MEQADTDCRSLLEDAPDNASGQLRTRLSDRMKSVADAAVKARREAAIRQAQRPSKARAIRQPPGATLNNMNPTRPSRPFGDNYASRPSRKQRMIACRTSVLARPGCDPRQRETQTAHGIALYETVRPAFCSTWTSGTAFGGGDREELRVVIEVCEKEFKELGNTASRISRRGRSGSTRHGRSTRSNSLRVA